MEKTLTILAMDTELVSLPADMTRTLIRTCWTNMVKMKRKLVNGENGLNRPNALVLVVVASPPRQEFASIEGK